MLNKQLLRAYSVPHFIVGGRDAEGKETAKTPALVMAQKKRG